MREMNRRLITPHPQGIEEFGVLKTRRSSFVKATFARVNDSRRDCDAIEKSEASLRRVSW